jgi:hypothetical protein
MIAKSAEYLTVCADCEHSGHLKNRTFVVLVYGLPVGQLHRRSADRAGFAGVLRSHRRASRPRRGPLAPKPRFWSEGFR